MRKLSAVSRSGLDSDVGSSGYVRLLKLERWHDASVDKGSEGGDGRKRAAESKVSAVEGETPSELL